MSVAKGFRLSDDSTAKLDWNYVTKPDGTKSIIEEVNDVKQDLADLEGGGLTAEVKAALDQLAQKVAYIDEDGQDYYDALHNALYPPTNLTSITCVYTQSGTVHSSDSLDSLKSDLVVTAHYSDSTTATVTTYTLSGTLTVGTSTITVTYGGKTTTFTVTVSDSSGLLYNWDFTNSLTDSIGNVTAVLGNCERTSDGVAFDGGTDYITLGNVFGFGKTMEIDYEDASAAFGNVNGIWFWTDQDIHSGFGFRYNSSASLRGYAWYTHTSGGTGHWYTDVNYNKTAVSGSGTLKVYIDPNGYVHAYVNGNELTLLYGNSTGQKYTSEAIASYITLGSPSSSYPAFYNVTIKAVRIYEGV